MKILAIGNSFSEDATKYLHQIAKGSEFDLTAVNLFIGGCSLERHMETINEGQRVHHRQVNGIFPGEFCSIKEGLLSGEWDVVTIQQVSHKSGLEETYEPYGSQLLEYVTKYAPNAKVYFHRTWAYEIDSMHGQFPNYDCDQQKMYDMIISATDKFCANHNLPIIKAGDVIQALRKTPEFDYAKGGESLCRDGFHMNLIYGRYAVAATWFETLTGKSIFDSTFVPEGADEEKIEVIKKIVHSMV
ncbi:MAG: DUF4886 domain-containing protein [Clostridia bacterium]|nr:DUF4886 domain-containing protein [Clostridia bacterium]